MTPPTLLVIPDHEAGRNLFAFDHAMAHRSNYQVMGPLPQWTVMPYWIDPFEKDARPATKWHLNHQRSHDDFNSYLPADRASTVPGIPSRQNLIDSNLQDDGIQSWWTFLNFQEHMVATDAVLPLPLTETLDNTPWWVIDPRLISVFW